MRKSDLIVLLLIILLILLYNIINGLRRRQVAQTTISSKKTVQDAAEQFSEQGYRIVAIQKQIPVTTKIDGKDYHYTMVADLVVKKARKTYLVEVRAGRKTNRRITSVRAQKEFLPQFLLYRPDGILIFDTDTNKIREIDIKVHVIGNREIGIRIICVLLGLLIGWVYFKFFGI